MHKPSFLCRSLPFLLLCVCVCSTFLPLSLVRFSLFFPSCVAQTLPDTLREFDGSLFELELQNLPRAIKTRQMSTPTSSPAAAVDAPPSAGPSVRLYDLKFRVDRIRRALEAIKPHRVLATSPPAFVSAIHNASESYVHIQNLAGSAQREGVEKATVPFKLQGTWVYLEAAIPVPVHWPASEVWVAIGIDAHFSSPTSDAVFPAGPEGAVWVDGVRVGAYDREHRRLHVPRDLVMAKEQDRKSSIVVQLVLFTGRIPSTHSLTEFQAEWRSELVESLYWSMHTGLELAKVMDQGSSSYFALVNALDTAAQRLDFRSDAAESDLFLRSAKKAIAAFDHFLASGSSAEVRARFPRFPAIGDNPRVVALGHSHIDIAWLWEIAQTRHKAHRTFGTQLRLLEEYPDWVFMQSSPQIYQWIEDNDPLLFRNIVESIKSKRWEAEGAMWCESDTNLPNGESLVRQLLYGKMYFQEKLGVDSKVAWLPDVFGYSAALPQLFALAQVPYFVTSKISWSQFNRFPYDSFEWIGIDGISSVLTHFITTPPFWGSDATYYTYNSLMMPVEVKGAWDKYQQKALLQSPLLTFGFGDGGGGVTEEMLEVASRLNGASLEFSTARASMDGLAEKARQPGIKMPRWIGELYLEYHRGTYTSQAWIKRANRKGETLFQQTEWLLSLAIMHNLVGPSTSVAGEVALVNVTEVWGKIRACWEKFLMLQFHDILPGSSTTNVYTKESRPMHDEIQRTLLDIRNRTAQVLASHMAVSSPAKHVMFNTLWFERDGIPAGGWVAQSTPFAVPPQSPPGAVVESTATENGGLLVSHPRWRIAFDALGRISSLYDKDEKRNVIPEGKVSNEFLLFRDDPMMWSAWDIDSYYEEMPIDPPMLVHSEVVRESPSRLVVKRKFVVPPRNKSTIDQSVVIDAARDRIDFETRADWHDSQFLLKVAFPVDVLASEAAHEIQFGHIRRPTHKNTQWDVARFETSHHRWVDVSEAGYGAAVLNDCKYGNDVQGSTIRLTLIKAPISPDPDADKGAHVFTYSFLPHAGSLQEALVVRHGADLNNPLFSTAAAVREADGAVSGTLLGKHRLAHTASPVKVLKGTSVVVDSLKPAESNLEEDVIVRIYESHGGTVPEAVLAFARPVAFVKAVDLLEEQVDERVQGLAASGHQVSFSIRAFQIISLRIRFERSLEL
eukprot:ANDGO_02134.mRNA.1 Alpha-mannosidase G